MYVHSKRKSAISSNSVHFFCFASAQYPFKPNFIFHTSTQIYWYVFWILIWMIELSWIVCGCYFFLFLLCYRQFGPFHLAWLVGFVDFVKSFTGWNVMQIESTIFFRNDNICTCVVHVFCVMTLYLQTHFSFPTKCSEDFGIWSGDFCFKRKWCYTSEYMHTSFA